MIARVWQGTTAAEHADAYLHHLAAGGGHGSLGRAGNRGVVVLRRCEGDETRFLMLSLWRDADAIRAFTGDDIESIRYDREDLRMLRTLPRRLQKYQVELLAGAALAGGAAGAPGGRP